MITILISTFGAIILTSLIWLIIMKNQNHLFTNANQKLTIELQNIGANVEFQVAQKLNEKLNILNDEIFNLKQNNIEIERTSYNKGKKEGIESFANEYYIQVYPYTYTYKDENGLYIFNQRKEFVEIGYKYQLFVKGIPVFKAQEVALETHEKSKFQLNEEAIKDMVKLMLAGSAPGAGAFMKVADKVQAK